TGPGIGRGGTWIGDVDGDGVPDYLTGTPVEGLPLYVISGADAIDGTATDRAIRTFYDPETPGLGFSVDNSNIAAAIGDITGDGISELAVGSRNYRTDPDGTRHGRVVVFDGLTGAVLYRIEAPLPRTPGDDFGQNVVAVGDLNGDGKGDFVVSDRG